MGSGGTNWVAIAAIVATPVTAIAAGLVGYFLGGRRDRDADIRRFDYDRDARVAEREHERALRSADDLVARIDEVEEALETLRGGCVEIQNASAQEDWFESMEGPFERAQERYDAVTAQIARLGIRPRAGA